MDAATLTALAIGLLTGIVSKAGEDVYGKSKELATHVYEAIRKRFAHEQDGGNASQALQTFMGGDTDFSTVIEKKLLNILNADPTFAHELTQLVQSGPHQALIAAAEAKASHIRMSNTSGRGHQEVNLGERASADDVQFTIGPEKLTP
ncbi:MAG TPA: hypothetical protein VKY19_15945 [Ktedonosporobacter sp.]|jgi:hypothetical protein|nr:hypothetical protein [Ktedonosporobacter sp.]